MGIEEFNFASAVLSGQNFAGLASLVAGLVQEKDATNVGLTYLEMQDLIKSFGMETCVNLGRAASSTKPGVLDASSQLFWALPLSEVQKFNVPVVIGSDIVSEIVVPKDENMPAGDEHFIKALANGAFVSGQMLGEELNISRTAISKHIKALISMELDIYSVRGKGYKLSKSLNLLSQKKIIDALPKGNSTPKIEVHSLIDSTNSYLLRRLPNHLSQGQVCVAEYQSAGRGRRGRQWISPFGSQI